MSYEIFERLCNQNNTKPFHVSKATGVSTPTLTAWKNGQYTPKADKLQKIADYFGVSLEYLQTGKDKEKESTEGTAYYFNDETAEIAQEIFENKELRLFFHNVRAMPPEDLAVLRNMAEALIRKEKHDH